MNSNPYLSLTPLLAFKDNYIWCISNSDNQHCLVVDPGDAAPVLAHLKAHDLILDTILITHHHPDHTGGIAALKAAFPALNVITPILEPIKGSTQAVRAGISIYLPFVDVAFEVIDLPGHTLGHIGFYNDNWLFCGDTLFSFGCGRLFEGTPEMMFESLSQLKALDPNLWMCCTHEYTLSNLTFALAVEPNHSALKAAHTRVTAQRADALPTLPVKLSEELALNPFLRCHEKGIIEAVSKKYPDIDKENPKSVFAALRRWKDKF